MNATEIMTAEEREVFEKLHIIRYEEALRDMQKARRERVLAECAEKEAQEQVQLIQFQIAISQRYFKPLEAERQGKGDSHER